MNIKLIAIDMDGTALNSSNRLDDRTLNAVQRAVSKGIIVIPATGRTLSAIPDEFMEIPEIPYLITSNGADIIDKHAKTSIKRSLLSPKEALEVAKRLQKYELYFYVHWDGRHYDTEGAVDPFAGKFPEVNADFKRTSVPDILDFIQSRKEGVEKVGGLCFSEETYNAIIREEEKFGHVNMASTGALSLEFNAPDASKGNALKYVCEHLNISPSQVMVLGDNQNDVSMFRYAGLGIAMENAIDELKAIASEITFSCDNFGVAAAIEKIL